MSTLNLTDEPPNAIDEYKKVSQMKSGANWFFWIAGLSMVNSLIFIFGGNWSFFAGLAITQVADALVVQISGDSAFSIVKFIALTMDFIIAGIFVLCGVFAGRMQAWAFIIGMIIYALDGILALLLGAYLSAGFHVFALIMIFTGFSAARHLKAENLST